MGNIRMDQPTPSPTSGEAMAAAPANIAKEHRQRLFGWLSWEMVVQSLGGVVMLAIAWTKLSDKMDAVQATQIETHATVKEIQDGVNNHSTQLAVQQIQDADTQAKIKVLFDGRAEDRKERADDRKVTEDILGKVGILLDRTDNSKAAVK
jgi:hypothetical protein